MSEKYTIFQNMKIHYVVEGHGTPLVMLHGNGESLQIFRKQARLLSNFFQVIRIDSRYHGRSSWKTPKASDNLSILQMSEDICEFLNAQNIAPAIILGYSDGANIALELATHHPDQVLAVISISGNSFPKGLRLPVYLLSILRYQFYRVLENAPLSKRLLRIIKRKRQLSGLMANQPLLTSVELGQIQAPVLILTGERDLIRPSHSVWMGKQIPNAKVIFIKQADHYSFFHKTELYMKSILPFLKKYRKI